ncbi:HAD family hydrolase [Leptospira ilyithenensis]|uniref:Haloacid dehalogenase-like hydrolase n=1 Tax=Leptospira ilyithenensis TaxID=2484901 RepID=A0A4R9LLY5_9LEPT|nr:haloacid dehalogenase-like hydrolase [Leptospira ilyithenensis]TGN09129.1 haloacid dehalogenase-like hydrolase [Leptospira ilyithenensis]
MTSFPLKSWAPSVHASLTQIISSSPGLACFDFDNTLIRNDFGEKIMDSVISEGMLFLPDDLSLFFRDKDYWKNHKTKPISEKEHLVWEEYTYQLKEFGIEKGYRWTSFIFQGYTKDGFYDLSRRTWEKVARLREGFAVFPQKEMLDLIEFLNSNHWKIYIVTASPEDGIRAIAHHFPVKEENVIGMVQKKNPNGIYAHEIIEPYTYGEGKVKAIQSRIGEIPDLVFGDSFNDYPMLCYARKLGVAIDRGNPEFVKACSEKGISIQPYFALET